MKRVLCIWLIISGIAFAADFEPKGPLVAAIEEASFDAKAAERFAKLALACVHKEYPNKIAHVLNSDADVAPPRKLTPAFCGCYDCHSSVHGHWLLVRLLRTFPDAPFAKDARDALKQGMDILAGAVLETREVARSPSVDRHSCGGTGPIQRSNALFAKEEESPVPAVVELGNENGPAHGTAELVPL